MLQHKFARCFISRLVSATSGDLMRASSLVKLYVCGIFVKSSSASGCISNCPLFIESRNIHLPTTLRQHPHWFQLKHALSINPPAAEQAVSDRHFWWWRPPIIAAEHPPEQKQARSSLVHSVSAMHMPRHRGRLITDIYYYTSNGL